MKVKYSKKSTEDEIRELYIECKKLTEKAKELYNNYATAKYGGFTIQHLPCDSCESDNLCNLEGE